MKTTADPYMTKTKRVSWKTFDRLLDCFRNDTRVFVVTDDNAGVHEHPMGMSDIIDFWEGGIEGHPVMQHMMDILYPTSMMDIGETITEVGWTIKRIA